MKKILFVLPVCVLAVTSCKYRDGRSVFAPAPKSSAEIVDSFLTEFQYLNPKWAKSEEGREKLAKAFCKEMTTNMRFAKACASYAQSHDSDSRFYIHYSQTISPYSKDNGEDGEIKVFPFEVSVDLEEPLNNGEKKVTLAYEIINPVPSTVENHEQPYVESVDTCVVFKKVFNYAEINSRVYVGSYLVTSKEN